MKVCIPSLFLLSSILLSSCSYISKQSMIANRDKQYLSARSIAPLQIPPGVATPPFETLYPVAHQHYPEASKKVSIVPPGL